jgi:hypothetical protein
MLLILKPKLTWINQNQRQGKQNKMHDPSSFSNLDAAKLQVLFISVLLLHDLSFCRDVRFLLLFLFLRIVLCQGAQLDKVVELQNNMENNHEVVLPVEK